MKAKSPRASRPKAKGRTAASAVSPEYPLLGFLSIGPAHGYELKRRLSGELPGLWNLSESQLYATLKRLEGRGLITARLPEGVGRAARRRFHLTPAGTRHLEAWLTSPTPPSVRAVRVEFLTRLHFALLRDRGFAREILERQSESIRQALSRLQASLRPGPALPRLAVQLRIRQLRSAIEWLGECRTALGLARETETG